jgi:hypothetical protein
MPPRRSTAGPTAPGNGYQTHSAEDEKNPWWEVDLGGSRPIDTVVVWNRTNAISDVVSTGTP